METGNGAAPIRGRGARTAPAIAVTLIVLTATTPLHAQATPLDRLAWFAGCWELRAPGRTITEMWMPPAGGTMMGASRTIAGGTVREYEQLRLVARGDTLVYIASPARQATTEFRSTSVSDTSVTFENPAHDFPKVIAYTRRGSDSLIARISAGGSAAGTQFRMRRISCTEIPAPPPAREPAVRNDVAMIRSALPREEKLVRGRAGARQGPHAR